jgi:hypothetical protein
VPFLEFPKEAGFCDVVRARYDVGDRGLEVAQSRHLISVKIGGCPVGWGASNAKVVAEVAGELLVEGDTMSFEKTGNLGSRVCGRHAVAAAKRKDAEWPHWFDQIRWWREGDQVGFITIKATGGPTRELITCAEEENLNWFE